MKSKRRTWWQSVRDWWKAWAEREELTPPYPLTLAEWTELQRQKRECQEQEAQREQLAAWEGYVTTEVRALLDEKQPGAKPAEQADG